MDSNNSAVRLSLLPCLGTHLVVRKCTSFGPKATDEFVDEFAVVFAPEQVPRQSILLRCSKLFHQCWEVRVDLSHLLGMSPGALGRKL